MAGFDRAGWESSVSGGIKVSVPFSPLFCVAESVYPRYATLSSISLCTGYFRFAGRNRIQKLMANYNQGAQVEHPKFGLGAVMSHTDERIVIKFDDHGEKKFVTTMVIGLLKKSDRQAPVEKRATRARKPKAVPVQA